MTEKKAQRIADKIMDYIDANGLDDDWDYSKVTTGEVRNDIKDIIRRVCWEGEK